MLKQKNPRKTKEFCLYEYRNLHNPDVVPNVFFFQMPYVKSNGTELSKLNKAYLIIIGFRIGKLVDFAIVLKDNNILPLHNLKLH